MDILESIGNTPLLELKKVNSSNSGRVMVKLEWANPTGSMKDRMAWAAIEATETDGSLPPDGTVVEYPGGFGIKIFKHGCLSIDSCWMIFT